MALSDTKVMNDKTTHAEKPTEPTTLTTDETEHEADRNTGTGRNILRTAAALATFTTIIHVMGGGYEIAGPAMRSDMEEVPRLVTYVVWHMASVSLGLSAIALTAASTGQRRKQFEPLVLFISAMWASFALCFLAVIITQEGDDLFFNMPQWLLLMPVGLLGIWSVTRHNRAAS